MELIPLAIEATVAVGHEVKELGKDLKHAYEIRELQTSNASLAAAFNDTWVYRISTTLHKGTAEMSCGVAQGEKKAHERGEDIEVPSCGRQETRQPNTARTTRRAATRRARPPEGVGGGTSLLTTNAVAPFTTHRGSARADDGSSGNAGAGPGGSSFSSWHYEFGSHFHEDINVYPSDLLSTSIDSGSSSGIGAIGPSASSSYMAVSIVQTLSDWGPHQGKAIL